MRLSALAAIVLLLAGCDLPPDAGFGTSEAEFAKVDQARLEAAESDPDNCLIPSRWRRAWCAGKS